MERLRRMLERGQSSLEFVGITILAAILVGAVVVSTGGRGETVKTAVAEKICQITKFGDAEAACVPPAAGPGTDDTGDDDVPTYLDPDLSPEQKATDGDYVALGDSFSSGEGGSEYEPDTDENYASGAKNYYESLDDDGNAPPIRSCNMYGCIEVPRLPPRYANMCHRSTQAYGPRVSDMFDFKGDFTFAACSGAVTKDFTEPNFDPDKNPGGNQGEKAQIENLDEDTSLVTFSIGGNDAKFADTLTQCIKDGLNPFARCFDDQSEKDDAQANIQTARENLKELLPKIREQAPNARILVVGYPRFFPEDPGSAWSDGTQIDTEDIKEINKLVSDMNNEIKKVIDELNQEHPGSFEYVDVEDAFNGCEIGTDHPCMNNITTRMSDGKVDKNGSYHPNDKGHEKMAEKVKEKVKNGS